MLSVRDSFTKNCHPLFVKLMGVISTHQRNNYCDDILYCSPWYGRQAQHCHKVKQCLSENKQSISEIGLSPPSVVSLGWNRRKKKKNREALKVLYSVTKFSFRAHILIAAFLSSPPGKPRKTNFFLLK